MPSTANETVALRLREAADLLDQQGANPFRVSAYRRAADRILALDRDLAEIAAAGGSEDLVALPDIGRGIAGAIEEILRTGRWAQLERLRGAAAPEQLFQTIPGIGPELAGRLHDHLHVDSLESLEVAAHDGRLETVPGVGRRRSTMIRSTLAALLGRRRPWRPPGGEEPEVGRLLDVDREYREQALRDALPRIAPRRFNPTGEAWLPVLHTERGPWQITALYSNTARAHELGRTRDWVILYFHADDRAEGQRTVVTETRGPLTGRRVVRGRERECELYYGMARSPAPA